MMGLKSLFGNRMENFASDEVDELFAVRPEFQDDVPKTHFRLRPGKTLSERRWKASFSQEGQLDIAKVLTRIQRGGVHPSIKGEVWEFLLGCFDPNSTFDERNQRRQLRREQYCTWKAECKNMVPIIGRGRVITSPIITDEMQHSINSDSRSDGETMSTSSPDTSSRDSVHVNDAAINKKMIQWKQSLHQIASGPWGVGLDVVRTDRTLEFYESEINQAKLWDVLAVYAWVDYDIGYCQGMSDICSPMIILLEDEADAFWCFERTMRKLRENFRCSTSSVGVQSQLGTLSEIIKAVDPKLHQHLEDLDGGEYLFAFRMLMVLFRREFSFVDVLYLWELMWAMEYNPNIYSSYERSSDASDDATDKGVASKISAKLLKQYGKFERKNVKSGCKDQHSALAVFLVASVLETKNKRLLKEAKGLDDVVKILGDITGNLDAKKACDEALKLQKKYLNKAKKS